MSGTIQTGNIGLRYWQITGTTPSIATGWNNYNMPTGCLSANTVYVFGSVNNGTSIMPFNHFYTTTDNWMARVFANTSGNTIQVNIPSGATSSASQPFTAYVVTTA